MKTKILVALCSIALCSNLSAQSSIEWLYEPKDYNYYAYAIDSLATRYSTEEPVHVYGKGRFLFKHQAKDLSDKERKKLIRKIEKLFKQNEDENLYHLGYELLGSMYRLQDYCRIVSQKTSPEIDDMLMDVYLHYYAYPGNWRSSIEIETYLDKKSQGSKTFKKRYAELLAGKKKKYELDETDCLYFIGATVTGKMKEYIPALKKGLSQCSDEEQDAKKKRTYRYALIKLGDKEQRQYFLDNLMGFDAFPKEHFMLFRDDAFIWRYIEVNYASNDLVCVGRAELSKKVLTIHNIYPYIKNLPAEPEDHYYLSFDHWADTVYKWLLANKSTVQFDYEGGKQWVW
ncbi:hypothetical protein AGMMS4957_05320 [Bacteroidia bacterium]|nr:hypothetical protein AGMMS4957_05320 [Bacteroidia bacterium]